MRTIIRIKQIITKKVRTKLGSTRIIFIDRCALIFRETFIYITWDWVDLVSKGGHLVLYIIGKLIPLVFIITMLEGIKVSFKRVIALHRRVYVLGTLIFSDNIHHNYDQTCYF